MQIQREPLRGLKPNDSLYNSNKDVLKKTKKGGTTKVLSLDFSTEISLKKH